jgi:sodium/potassium-transporting ATPase subunit alpha
MLPAACVVVRDGQEVKVPAEQLVRGDIVHLTIGNRIPADMRLITVGDLKVEQSSLTGENEPIECTVQKQSDMVTEAKNFVFNSSLVMEGDARGVVVRTGDHTFIGSIAGLAGQTRNTKSSLEIEVEHVVRVSLRYALFA